jgi:hypothetical protein
MPPAHNP